MKNNVIYRIVVYPVMKDYDGLSTLEKHLLFRLGTVRFFLLLFAVGEALLIPVN